MALKQMLAAVPLDVKESYDRDDCCARTRGRSDKSWQPSGMLLRISKENRRRDDGRRFYAENPGSQAAPLRPSGHERFVTPLRFLSIFLPTRYFGTAIRRCATSFTFFA